MARRAAVAPSAPTRRFLTRGTLHRGMSDADTAVGEADPSDSMPLIPPGTVPRAVLAFHAAFGLGAFGLSALSLQQGALVQAVITAAIGVMMIAAGLAAGRLVARQ